MKRNAWLPLAGLLSLLAAGCFFEPYRPVVEFDLPPGEPVEIQCPVSVLEFRNDSTSGMRIQGLEPSGRVVRDPYNLWVLPPGQLVSRALNLSLAAKKKGATPLFVSGAVEVFEVDEERKAFRLAGCWFPPGSDSGTRFDFSVPVEGDSAEATVRAAAAAVRQLAEQIAAWSRAVPEGSK